MNYFSQFPEVLHAVLLYIGGYIGSNSQLSNYAADTIESWPQEIREAYASYQRTYLQTEVLKAGFGLNK